MEDSQGAVVFSINLSLPGTGGCLWEPGDWWVRCIDRDGGMCGIDRGREGVGELKYRIKCTCSILIFVNLIHVESIFQCSVNVIHQLCYIHEKIQQPAYAQFDLYLVCNLISLAV